MNDSVTPTPFSQPTPGLCNLTHLILIAIHTLSPV
ncbi:hypothetical protein FHX64_001617 [Microbacter margulisiae]|uniref:Uncharacterized protein n=1 Tax=Microbacter margulisiae TaxID=1350067 RepID=A0A7W5DQY3_9PORP|nr:hypothetical protein [Microbacter margulisiae]